MRGFTPLVRMLAHDYVSRYHVDYEEALDRIYRSEILKKVLDPNTTFATWAPRDLLDLYERTEA
jgi:hypothetical protein